MSTYGTIAKAGDSEPVLLQKICNNLSGLVGNAALPVKIQDGFNNNGGTLLNIQSNGAALVTSDGYPRFGNVSVVRPFVSFFTGPAASTDMRVVGTLGSPITFSISAAPDADRYITALAVLVSDAGALMNQFGAIAALTNGCILNHVSSITGTFQLMPPFRTNFELVRLCLGTPAFGDGATAFRANNVIGASEAFFPTMILTDIVPPSGLRLPVASLDRLDLLVRDNTTAIDAFNIIAFGFDRLPDAI